MGDWSLLMKAKKTANHFSVTEFKAKCLRILDDTWKKGKEYTITKKGLPIARVIPIRKLRGTRLGSLKGLATIDGDIVHFDTSEEWDVLKK
jgi:prevent-host-death family protein